MLNKFKFNFVENIQLAYIYFCSKIHDDIVFEHLECLCIIHYVYYALHFLYIFPGTFFWDGLTAYLVATAVGIPISVMVVCYTRMIYALYKSSRSLGTSNSANSDKLRLAQQNIFQTCLIMIVVFLVCWITFEVAGVMYILKIYKNLTGTHFTIGTLLTILNSGINPYIYVFRYEDFKIQLRKLVSRRGITKAKSAQCLSKC